MSPAIGTGDVPQNLSLETQVGCRFLLQCLQIFVPIESLTALALVESVVRGGRIVVEGADCRGRVLMEYFVEGVLVD